MKQCPIDFFDPEVQHLAASAGCRLYRMQNDTGEGLISEYPILSGIDLFYNDFHMKDGQNQNKRPMPDTIEINHCREGRFECEFQNGDYQYIGAGDLSIHRLSHTTRQTRFPLAHYHGISITIDLPRAQQTLSSLEAIMGDLDIHGSSIYQYMKTYRMQTARVLLQDTSRSVTEIAATLGYDNPSKFSEAFKKEYGISPTLFRNSPSELDVS